MAGRDEIDLDSLVGRLDETIPREGIVVVDDDADGTLVIANRAGYLRLGVEFLKAGLADSEKGHAAQRVDVELDYLVGLEEVC